MSKIESKATEETSSNLFGSQSTSNWLMLILIIVTAYFGIINIVLQKDAIGLQREIYRPLMTAIDVSPPFEITDSEYFSVGIVNNGYVSGVYSIEITSNEFRFDFNDQVESNKVEISYALQHGNHNMHEIVVHAPKNPVRTMYAQLWIKYSSIDGPIRQDSFCYQLSQRRYTQIICPS